ncbi:ion channel [Leeuwenhoekiella sp. W20_SRS_FM14]|uniref:ion channel n=1 Tax=Leeuwenhoekiella sp. W20_SRS_FM14 TaxID=3240270 RepID=UPI003F9B2CF4
MSIKESSSKYSQKNFNDFGLGEKATAGNYRVLNKNGSFNIKKDNVGVLERINFFHVLVSMSWLQFLLIILGTYFCINLLFASLYMLVGIEHLTGIYGTTFLEQFTEAFFFSAQTITTLGYGQVAPIGILTNILAATESMMGLLGFALATGMVYGRFSKPAAKLKYSKFAVIAPYQDINGFMFRVVNPHGNQLLELEASVSLSILRENSELRSFFPLDLERSKVAFLPATWTLVHPITRESPFYQIKPEAFFKRDAEIIIVIKAFDESFSQSVYSRSSYKFNEIKWGEKFTYLISQKDGRVSVDVSGIDNTEPAKLNGEI